MQDFVRFLLGALLCLTLLSGPVRAASPASAKIPMLPGWTLTFDDEFNGKSLDLSKWTPTDWASDINGELEYYVPDDVWVQNGYLRLQSRKRAHGGRDYTSGEVRSVGKFSQLYGRFEFRARLPQTFGTWSAEYLIAENDHWPPEIDVEEYLGREPQRLHMTMHWQDALSGHQSYHTQRDASIDYYTKWHVYAVEWDPKEVRWYIDGTLYGTSSPGSQVSMVPMYIRINTALGGWAAYPRPDSVWPQFHDIDYVRVYRRTAWPPPVNAGPDQEFTLGNGGISSITLTGLSCNPMGAHRATWSEVGGAHPVTFTHPHALSTAATFSAPGTYRLRLTVDDGTASGHDDMTIFVNPAQSVQLTPSADAYTFVNSNAITIHADGTGQELNVGTRRSIGGSHDTMASYLNFDLSHTPPVSHATLRLYGGMLYTGDRTTVRCIVSTVPAPQWDEKTTEWPALPATGVAIVNSTTANLTTFGPAVSLASMYDTLVVSPTVHHSTERWYEMDVTSYVQARQKAGDALIGFAVSSENNSDALAATFASREDAAHAPHLVITP